MAPGKSKKGDSEVIENHHEVNEHNASILAITSKKGKHNTGNQLNVINHVSSISSTQINSLSSTMSVQAPQHKSKCSFTVNNDNIYYALLLCFSLIFVTVFFSHFVEEWPSISQINTQHSRGHCLMAH